MQGYRLENVTDGVYAFVTDNGESNQGLVVTAEGVVVIDTYEKNVRRFEQALSGVTSQPVKYVINTHHDMDHASANHIFTQQGAVALASTYCCEWLRFHLTEKGMAEFQQRNPEVAATINRPGDVIPQVGFDGSIDITVGGKTLRCINVGHGHTAGDVVVHLPKEQVFFAGDLVFNRFHSRMKTANVEKWIGILRSPETLPIERVVPGHGMIGGRELITEFRLYMELFRDQVVQKIAEGFSMEEIQQKIDLGRFSDWDKKQCIPTAVENFYREYEWRSAVNLSKRRTLLPPKDKDV